MRSAREAAVPQDVPAPSNGLLGSSVAQVRVIEHSGSPAARRAVRPRARGGIYLRGSAPTSSPTLADAARVLSRHQAVAAGLADAARYLLEWPAARILEQPASKSRPRAFADTT